VEAPPITHTRADPRGEFAMQRDGRQVGELTYTIAGNRLTILHTGVDTSLRGTGAAKKLVEAAVQWARAENLMVASRCGYASALFAKTPEAYADVIAG
jgi:predicted GNAT family acetyltransferase